MVPVGRRWSSESARAGTRRSSSPGSVSESGRSRIAMRYESVATMRMEPSTRDTSTPVSRGRPSSCDAARTTWRTASPRAVSDSWVVGSSVLPTGGNSTTGYVWSLKVDRAALMVMWSPWSANVTAPGSRRRTMSVDSRAGMTQLPSSMPITSPVTWIVRSRSVPVTHSEFPSQFSRSPSSTGEEPPRPPTARLAVASMSTSASRSDLNFTATGPFGSLPSSFNAERDRDVSSKGSKGCGLWTTWSHPCWTQPRFPHGTVGRVRPRSYARSRSVRAWGQAAAGPQATRGRSTAFASCKPQLGRRRGGGGDGQAEPARIFWISSVTCS